MTKLAMALAMVGLAVGASFAAADPGGYGPGMGMRMGCGSDPNSPAAANCPMWGGGDGAAPACARGGASAEAGCARGPGSGMGPGMGPRYGEPGRGFEGGGTGIGPRGGHRAGGGATLLTPEERVQFRNEMHAVTSVDACKAVVAKHRELVQQRAKEKGVTAPPGPREDMCERMQARGMLG